MPNTSDYAAPQTKPPSNSKSREASGSKELPMAPTKPGSRKKQVAVTCEKTLESDLAYPIVMIKLKEDGFQSTEKLGSGSYSVVLKAVKHDKPCAVKIISTRVKNDYVVKFLPREMDIVCKLNHPNVLKFHNVRDYRTGNPTLPFVVFVSEWAEGGDLLKKIKRVQKTGQKGLSEPDMKLTFHQLIEALDYLDQRNIVHRDLKCENIMLDHEENVKLGDFGFARVIQPAEKSHTFCGSRAYVAPEIILGKAYRGRPADVWSVGVVMFVSVTGHFPWDERYQDKMVQDQLGHKVHFSKKWVISKELRKVIMDMLMPYPDHRPSYQELLNNEFLKTTSGVSPS